MHSVKASYVDENLFGSSQSSKSGKNFGSKRIQESAGVVISHRDLQRIRASATIKTTGEIYEERERLEREKEIQEKISMDRKQRMKDLEKHAILSAKKSDLEVAQIAREDNLRRLASEKIDDNSDLVKMLASLGSRASAFTIRDAQLDERKERQHKEDAYDRRMDMEMEIDRLKDLKKREAGEADKRQKRIEDKKVIVEQMEYRQRMKLLDAEQREQENIAMRGVIKQYEVEAIEQAKTKASDIARSKLEVLKANEESIQRKLGAREMEKKEMQDILIYQQLKDAEMLKRELEEAANDNMKKERQAKLLAQQEKAQSSAGKLDEVRSRRAAEEHERRSRKKERDEALKKKADIAELLESRAKQAASRKHKQEQESALWEEEYRNGLEYMQTMAKREQDESHKKHAEAINHRNQLQGQISLNREQRAKDVCGKDEAGVQYRQDLIREEAKLNVIRDQMVHDMVNKGVNPKYLGEMKAVDIGKMLKR